MGRPRANASSQKITTRDAQRRALASTTGAVGGGGLAAFASNLPEPYNKLLIISAPTISILVAKFGPKILDLLTIVLVFVYEWVAHKISIMNIRAFLRNQRKRIKNNNLSDLRKSEIEKRISEAEIDDREYRRVAPYIVGDNQSGLHVSSGNEGTPPPGEVSND